MVEPRTCKRNRKLVLSCIALVLAMFVAAPAHAQGDRFAGRTITGTAYFIGGRTAARSLPFRLIIERLTNPEEVSRLNAALKAGGQDELLRTLSRMNAGRIQIGNDVGVTANAIILSEGDGRTKLTVLYERYLRFAELRYGTRSQDYRFGYAELFVGGEDKEGMLIPAAIVRLRDNNTWEVEDFSTFPARLMGLQVRGSGRSTLR